jgi:hypothetical protein
VDDREFFIELERIRAERRNPMWAWVGNLLWPGIGNLLVGDASGRTICLVTLMLWGLGLWSRGLLLPLLIVWYVVASVLGQRYAENKFNHALEQLKRRYEASRDQPSA